jgi:hypothetical protein
VVSSITSSSLSLGSLELYRNSKSNNNNNNNSSIKNRKTKNWNISSMTTKTANRIRGGDDSISDGGSSGDKADDAVVVAAAESTTIKPAAETVETDETNSSNKEKKEKKPFSWRDARRTLFPIHGKDEVTKFLLLGSIKFFIIMALTLTRDTKDTLVVTQCGAEAIAFLKVSSCEIVMLCYVVKRNSLFIFLKNCYQVSMQIRACPLQMVGGKIFAAIIRSFELFLC